MPRRGTHQHSYEALYTLIKTLTRAAGVNKMTRYGTDARYAHGKLLTTRPVVHALQNWVKSPTDLRYVSLLSSRLSLSLFHLLYPKQKLQRLKQNYRASLVQKIPLRRTSLKTTLRPLNPKPVRALTQSGVFSGGRTGASVIFRNLDELMSVLNGLRFSEGVGFRV